VDFIGSFVFLIKSPSKSETVLGSYWCLDYFTVWTETTPARVWSLLIQWQSIGTFCNFIIHLNTYNTNGTIEWNFGTEFLLEFLAFNSNLKFVSRNFTWISWWL